jgi:hypothetical protein
MVVGGSGGSRIVTGVLQVTTKKNKQSIQPVFCVQGCAAGAVRVGHGRERGGGARARAAAARRSEHRGESEQRAADCPGTDGTLSDQKRSNRNLCVVSFDCFSCLLCLHNRASTRTLWCSWCACCLTPHCRYSKQQTFKLIFFFSLCIILIVFFLFEAACDWRKQGLPEQACMTAGI